MTPGNWLARPRLDDLFAALRGTGTGWSARRSATAPSCTPRSRAARPPGGLDRGAGRRDATGWRAATTRRCSATRSGPQSWKQFFFVPRLRLWQRDARRETASRSTPRSPSRRAWRSSARAPATCTPSPCRTASSSAARTSTRTTRRGDATCFVVAVNCGQAGGTCFCVSMETGPARDRGLRSRAHRAASTARHRFLVEVGSDRGRRRSSRAGDASRRRERRPPAPPTRSSSATAPSMGRDAGHRRASRSCSTELEHPRWDDVAARCLALRQLHAGLPDLLLQRPSRT